MKVAVFSQVCPFFVSVLETATWEYPLHRHAHYELIYVLDGEGMHHLNGQHYPYHPDDVFLCNTSDAHRFDISRRTRFCIIKMNLSFLLAANDTFAVLQPLFEAEGTHPLFVLDAATKAYLRSQVEFCMREFEHRQFLYAHTIQASLLGVLVLLARERLRQHSSPTTAAAAPDNLVPAIIHYLHTHLQTPERLAAPVVAEHFHLAPGYIGQYFRRHTGQTLKAFIQKSRIRAIQLQLEFGDKTVSELAYTYGYTDESHLTKSFRAQTGETPTAYRSRLAAATLSQS
jgi:AraC-like DNA-binding protein